MSKNILIFENLHKARTHAIINLRASTNYVMCVPNSIKHLSKVDYATLEQQFYEICINISCLDNYKYSTCKYKFDHIKQLRGSRWSKEDKTWSFDQNDTAKLCKILRDNGIQYESDGILIDETNNRLN